MLVAHAIPETAFDDPRGNISPNSVLVGTSPAIGTDILYGVSGSQTLQPESAAGGGTYVPAGSNTGTEYLLGASGDGWYFADTTNTNAYQITVPFDCGSAGTSPCYSIKNRSVFLLTVSNSNTAAGPTLKINSSGSHMTIYDCNGQPLAIGALQSSGVYLLVVNATGNLVSLGGNCAGSSPSLQYPTAIHWVSGGPVLTNSSITAGAGAGSTATISVDPASSGTAHDSAFEISVTPGGMQTAGALLFSVVPVGTWSTLPICRMEPMNAPARNIAAGAVPFYSWATSTTTLLSFASNSGALLPVGSTYLWGITCQN